MRRVIFGLVTFLSLSSANATTLLHDNGGIVTGIGNGFNGANTSTWQQVTWTVGGSSTTLVGLGVNAGAFRIIDDFTVPTGFTWQLDALTVFGFKTVSSSLQPDPPVSPFTGMSFVLYDSFEAMQSRTPFFGSWGQNTLRSTEWTGAYRVATSQPTNRQRALMSVMGSATHVPRLASGRYWVEFGLSTPSATDTLATVPVMPHTTGGNAWQRDANTGQLYNLDPLEMPFQIRGTSQPVPEPMTLGALAVGLAMFGRRKGKR